MVVARDVITRFRLLPSQRQAKKGEFGSMTNDELHEWARKAVSALLQRLIERALAARKAR
jgi:predicted transcriptional regulator